MSEPQWIWQCERVIPSDAAAGRLALEEILEQLKAQQWIPHDVFSIHLAMHEALVNAMMHGNRQDARKQVHIRCRMSRDTVHVEIADEGPGFNPTALPNPTDPDRLERPCGRGVMLIKAFMSHVYYNEQGNCIVMEKQRQLG
jgi:serine/threonine-protein kinase RsbW